MADAIMVKKEFLQSLMSKAQAVDQKVGSALAKASKRSGVRGYAARAGASLWANKGSFLLTIGSGLATFLATSDWLKKKEWFRKYGWIIALLAIAIGYYIVRGKNQQRRIYGIALMSAGAIAGVLWYRARPKDEKSDEKPKEAGGFEDFERYPMMTAPGGQWVLTADGQQLMLPANYYPSARRETADPITELADEIYRG